MKKIIFTLLLLTTGLISIINLPLAQSYSHDPHIIIGGKPSLQFLFSSNLEQTLKNYASDSDVLIYFYIPSKDMLKSKTSDAIAEEKFKELKLNLRANPSLNLLFVFTEEDNGKTKMAVAYSKECGWNEAYLKQLLGEEILLDEIENYFLTKVFPSLNEVLANQKPEAFKTICTLKTPLTQTQQSASCKRLINEGDMGPFFKRIVFLFNNYGDKDFEKAVKKTQEILKDFSKYDFWSQNKNDPLHKFEWVYVNKNFQDICQGRVCDYVQMGHTSQGCAPDNVVVITNDDVISFGQFGGVSLNSYPLTRKNILSEFFNDESLLVHEFGHQIFCLADEYVEETSSRPEGAPGVYGQDAPRFPNCANSKEEAEAWWGNLMGESLGFLKGKVGRYDGCSYVGGNFRPTKTSIMQSLNANNFYPVNLRHMNNILEGKAKC